jgi:predicted TPR repeat methyltransferase
MTGVTHPEADIARSSGNLLADRRYDYARAALAEGDHTAAADLLEQSLELAPGWAAAWFALGEAREALGEIDAAVAAFSRAQSLDTAEAFGARLRIARLRGDSPDTAPAGYVRALFDQYAPRFETHLVHTLDYRAPELLREAIARICDERGRPRMIDHCVDLGCGTGLAARAMQDIVRCFSGVDLSPAMVRQAQASGLYRSLEAGDLVRFLEAMDPATADLVLAADVFVYIGDLRPVFSECARVLACGGLFAFTVQSHSGEGFILGDDLRFAHAEPYLQRLALACGLEVALLEPSSTRQDRGAPVPGLLAVLARI